jgi:dTDP-4-amino-4,6-dideoxy-D-galactose acyltransferase
MAEQELPFQLLPWDSSFFGRRIARVLGEHPSASELGGVVELARREGVDCLYYLIDPRAELTSQSATRAGFQLVDVRLTLEGPVPAAGVAVPGVRSARPEDVPGLRAIASSSHRDSRFYADEHFPRERCDALYATWIQRSVEEGFADAVLVASEDDDVLGYVTCQKKEDGSGQIGLLAVAAQARGKGLGKKLLAAALRWLAEQNVKRVSVVTQGKNAAAQRLYQQSGLLTRDAMLWYHLWPASVVK